MAGYAVECALKACIAKQTRRHEFPDKQRGNEVYTHDLNKLLALAGLEPAMSNLKKAKAQESVNWSIVTNWSESDRYRVKSRQEAIDMFQAVAGDLSGVLTWIRGQW